MCVLTALRLHDGNDRDELFLCLLRIKFWVLILICEPSWQIRFSKLQYNIGRRGMSWPLLLATCILWPHENHLILRSWPHVSVGVFVLCSLRISPLPADQISSASPPRNWWPHINHSVLGFDHIFDHKQIRSTRRQECTRVWKSRFCVAERARKSKNG